MDFLNTNTILFQLIASAIGTFTGAIVALYVSYKGERPSIVAYLDNRDNNNKFLAIENFGKGIAYNVSLNKSKLDSFISSNRFPKKINFLPMENSFIETGINILAPSKKRATKFAIFNEGDASSIPDLGKYKIPIELSYQQDRFLRNLPKKRVKKEYELLFTDIEGSDF